MSQHTPGPWTTTTMHENSVGPGPYPLYAHGEVIGWTSSLGDARLIAAAPEMLALIQGVAKEWPDVAEAMTARALLAKIEGKG